MGPDREKFPSRRRTAVAPSQPQSPEEGTPTFPPVDTV